MKHSPQYYSAFSEIPAEACEGLFPHARPFWHRSPAHKTIVLCFHGHGATPYEMSQIGSYLALNFDTAAPLFSAHGIQEIKKAQKAMGAVSFRDWLEGARAEIDAARRQYSQVFAVGQSMGGLIAMIMAAEKRLDACAVTAPALKLPRGSGLITSLLGFLNVNVAIDISNQPFFNEVYSFRNLHESRELFRLSLFARKQLKNINCPLYVAHSRNDATIDPIVVDWIRNQVQGPLTAQWFDDSSHSMTLDARWRDIAYDIKTFFTAEAPI